MQIHLDGSVITVTAEHTPKARLVIAKGSETDTYAFTDSNRDLFPLKFGAGEYTVKLCEPRFKTVYRVADSHKVTAQTSAWDTMPNQYVFYTQLSGCILEAQSLCAGMDRGQSVAAIREWIRTHIAYDYIRAAQVPKSGNLLPDIGRCYTMRRGICLDIAGMMAAMLRGVGIPARLEIGKRGLMRHAWVRLAYGAILDPTLDIERSRKKTAATYRMERYY